MAGIGTNALYKETAWLAGVAKSSDYRGIGEYAGLAHAGLAAGAER
jgi:hypothetical protein